MLRSVLLLAAIALSTQIASSKPADPDAREQTALVARMRDSAQNYASQLQDFLCTQLTTRSVDQSGSGTHWKLLETQELELGYIAHREHYRLLKVNGKATDPEKRVKHGYFTPGGEFGTSLDFIFSQEPGPNLPGITWSHRLQFLARDPAFFATRFRCRPRPTSRTWTQTTSGFPITVS